LGFSIISFSKTVKYKVLLWSLVGIGGLCFAIGGIILLTGNIPTGIPPSDILLSASGLQTNDDGSYSMTVYKQSTPLSVFANNGNNNGSPVRFSVANDGSSYLETPKSVYLGGLTNIVLKTDKNNGNSFFYGRQNIEIHIQCGRFQKKLLVNIEIPEEKVGFSYSLYDASTLIPNIAAGSYYSKVYGTLYGPQTNMYKFVPAFYIDGKQIPLAGSMWKAEPLENDYSISLIGTVTIPEVLLQTINETLTIRFLITATYLYKDYVDIYTLTIVP